MPKRKAQDEFDDDFDVLAASNPKPGASSSSAGTSRAGKNAKTAPPSSARKSGASNSKKASPEKRLARHKKACPRNIADRVFRVQTQRFFMIDRQRQGDELKEIFKVLGSTGNVYTVIVSHLPSCDCPDASKGNHCKHILFVFLKVLGQNSATSPYFYQKALLSSELQDIFDHAPASPQHVMSNRITQAYKQANGEEEDKSAVKQEECKPGDTIGDAVHGKRRLPSEGDTCPVCYEDFEAGQTDGLVFCAQSCGGGLHKQCFQQWCAASRGNVTCVYCRAAWPSAASASNLAYEGAAEDEGYTNLASAAGLSGQRDTSTYHNWGRRGWGSPDYGSRFNRSQFIGGRFY